MDQEHDYADPEPPTRVRGPIERTIRALALTLVAVVLLGVWVIVMAFVEMLSNPLSRRPTSKLWGVVLIGVPLAIFLSFIYRYRPRFAVTAALLAAWVGVVWVVAVLSSG